MRYFKHWFQRGILGKILRKLEDNIPVTKFHKILKKHPGFVSFDYKVLLKSDAEYEVVLIDVTET
ncbi:MAG: hypothetical protein K2P90_03265 [Holosporales bacterium]|nr:hypothetical protein [Holosporales bacterium]